MRVIYDDVAPTEHQLRLAERVEAELAGRAQYDRVLAPPAGNGPSIEFRLHTRPPDLSVQFILYQDSFHIIANEADVRIELDGPGQFDAWADQVVAITSRLLDHPLRIRVRRPFLKWLPSDGAIYLTDGKSGSWNGGPTWGGVERLFEAWYKASR